MMNRDDNELIQKVVQALEHGTHTLKEGLAYRLHAARQEALARNEQAKTVPELALAGAGRNGTLGGLRATFGQTRFWISLAFLLGALAYYQHWQSTQSLAELTETDSAILADELPVDAYLDRGFHNWLKNSEE